MMSGISGVVTAGLKAASQRVDRTALAVATGRSADGEPVDIAKAAADLAQQKADIATSAAVVRSGTRMSTHLVDMLV